MSDIQSIENHRTGYFGHSFDAFKIYRASSIIAKGLRFTSQLDWAARGFHLQAEDSLFVQGVTIEGLSNQESYVFRCRIGGSGRGIVRDVRIRANHYLDRSLFLASSADWGHLQVRNIVFENNEYLNEDGQYELNDNSNVYIGSIENASVDVDSIYVRSNRLQGALRLLTVVGPGQVRNLYVEENECGPALGPGGFVCYLDRNISIRDSYFRNNSVRIWREPGSEPYTEGGTLLLHRTFDEDSVLVQNLEFSGNEYLDPDDHPLEQIVSDLQSMAYEANPTNGRVYAGNLPGQARYFLMDSCLFVDNSCPVILPEVNTPFGDELVGSTVLIGGATGEEAPGTRCIIRNTRFVNCDDGALQVINPAEFLQIQNLDIVDCKRMGLRVRNFDGPNTQVRIENVLVHNLQKQWAFMSYPWDWSAQFALSISSTEEGGSLVSNVTVSECDVVLLTSNYNLSSGNKLWNSLLWDNEYESFYRPNTGDLEYAWCVLPEERPGEGNQVNVNPFFDEELGAPYLSPFSPLIDAGSPDSVFHDREDPAMPGAALWPSQGGLRNDIGYTGGPGAMSLEQLVSVPALPRAQAELPKTLSLFSPSPNPFNPATTLRFHLSRAGKVEMDLFNIRGQRVRRILEEPLSAGEHQRLLHAGNLSSGLYIVQLKAHGAMESKKLLLLK